MPPKNIKEFFSPCSSPSSYKRPRSSPESEGVGKKQSMEGDTDSVENVSPQLMQALSILFDRKLSVLATKEDIKSINADMEVIKEENVKLKDQLYSLKRECEDREDRITDLEIKYRRENLVFRGLKVSEELQSDPAQVVIDFCTELLDLKLDKKFINAYSPAKKVTTGGAPLVVSFMRPQDKVKVLSSARKLKGTGFFVHPDFPFIVRKRRLKLSIVKKELVQRNPKLRVSLRGDKLWVNDLKFSWKVGIGLFHADKKIDKSLPELPGINFSEFLDMLVEDRLPVNYFTSRKPPQPQASPS